MYDILCTVQKKRGKITVNCINSNMNLFLDLSMYASEIIISQHKGYTVLLKIL